VSAAPHVPVLIDEVLDALAIAPGEVHVDGTFGAGGYSSAMADAGARVFAFDRDPDAIAAAIRAILDDPPAQSAVREAALRFTWQANGDALLAHLQSIAASG